MAKELILRLNLKTFLHITKNIFVILLLGAGKTDYE